MRVSMRPPRLGRGPSFENVTLSAEERFTSGGSRFRVCQQSGTGTAPVLFFLTQGVTGLPVLP